MLISCFCVVNVVTYGVYVSRNMRNVSTVGVVVLLDDVEKVCLMCCCRVLGDNLLFGLSVA